MIFTTISNLEKIYLLFKSALEVIHFPLPLPSLDFLCRCRFLSGHENNKETVYFSLKEMTSLLFDNGQMYYFIYDISRQEGWLAKLQAQTRLPALSYTLIHMRMIMSTIVRYYETFLQILRLPVATLSFRRSIDPENIRETYRQYTKRHPRYRIIRHKTVGAALIDLEHVNTREKYLSLIKGKNGGAFHAKRARSRGYSFAEIDRNSYIDAIHRINTSCISRQGRPMDTTYQEKRQHFEPLNHFRYYGIMNEHGELVAYANIGIFGNFCGFSQLLGLRNNDGVMHFLLVEIISILIDQGQVRYVMYDTFFGALPGMRQFKSMMGFRPYRAKYVLL